MEDNNVTIDPRYMKYDKSDVEALLDKVDHELVPAEEESVRNIVRNYNIEPEPEPEQETDQESEQE